VASHRLRSGILAALVAGLAAACGDVPAAPPASSTADGAAAAASPTTSATAEEETEMPRQPGLEGLVAQAVQDLSTRTGLAEEEIRVVSAEPTVWSDASLGCPQPGMRYAQVPQDGALIELEAGGRTYRYHTGGDRVEPFLCEQAVAKPPPVTPLEPRFTPPPDSGT
jgi:hypothetical protein